MVEDPSLSMMGRNTLLSTFLSMMDFLGAFRGMSVLWYQRMLLHSADETTVHRSRQSWLHKILAAVLGPLMMSFFGTL